MLQKYGSELLSGASLLSMGLAAVPGIGAGPFPWLGGGVALAVVAAIVRIKARESLKSMREERDPAERFAAESLRALRDAVHPLAFNLNE